MTRTMTQSWGRSYRISAIVAGARKNRRRKGAGLRWSPVINRYSYRSRSKGCGHQGRRIPVWATTPLPNEFSRGAPDKHYEGKGRSVPGAICWGRKQRDNPRRLPSMCARQMLHKTITDGWLPSAIRHIAEVYQSASGCLRGVQP